MKSKKIVVMTGIVAILSLGIANTSFARGGGMGGGFTGSRGAAAGPSGSGFGGRSAFNSSVQEINAQRGGYGEQSQIRSRENIQQRNGVPGNSGTAAAGNQQGYSNSDQSHTDGNRYGQRNGVNNNQGQPGQPATQAALATSAGN